MFKKNAVFSFGRNWKRFLKTVDDETIALAKADVLEWLGVDGVRDRSVIDIGSGSGLSSYAFFLLGARQILSFDIDAQSVEATRYFWEKAGRPENWKVIKGSALDEPFLESFGTFDIVYSWGVLHHTGRMWDAISYARMRVSPGGRLWISIYRKTDQFAEELALKQRYHRSSWIVRKRLILQLIWPFVKVRLKRFQNPFAWNRKKPRGMTIYRDIIDWLGGLPYEAATPEEVVGFLSPHQFKLSKLNTDESCIVYLFEAS